jgi:hypothetical protein
VFLQFTGRGTHAFRCISFPPAGIYRGDQQEHEKSAITKNSMQKINTFSPDFRITPAGKNRIIHYSSHDITHRTFQEVQAV